MLCEAVPQGLDVCAQATVHTTAGTAISAAKSNREIHTLQTRMAIFLT